MVVEEIVTACSDANECLNATRDAGETSTLTPTPTPTQTTALRLSDSLPESVEENSTARPLKSEERASDIMWKHKYNREVQVGSQGDRVDGRENNDRCKQQVNLELGRRVRKLKLRLSGEQNRCQQLESQLDELRTQRCIDTGTLTDGLQQRANSTACSNCEKLQAELQSMKFFLQSKGFHLESFQLETPAESVENAKPDISVRSKEDVSASQFGKESSGQGHHRSNSILIRAQSGKVHSLRDILDTLNGAKDYASDLGQASRVAPIPPSINEKPGKRQSHSGSFSPDNNSEYGSYPRFLESLPSLSSMVDLVGDRDIFKYAVVFACPSKSPNVVIGERRGKNTTDDLAKTRQAQFRRCRTCPDSATTTTPESFDPLVFCNPADEDDVELTASQSVSEEASPTPEIKLIPRKKAGWFTNFMTTRFRATTAKSALNRTETRTALATAAASSLQKAKVLTVYPPQNEELRELDCIQEFCFPYGENSSVQQREFALPELKRFLMDRNLSAHVLSSFVLVLSNATSATQTQDVNSIGLFTYAVCMICPLFLTGEDCDESKSETVVDSEAMSPTISAGANSPSYVCLCLVSSYPFFSFFFRSLASIAAMWEEKRTAAISEHHRVGMEQFTHLFKSTMEQLRKMQLPSMGSWGKVVLTKNYGPLTFHRPHSESLSDERRILVLEYAAPTLFSLLALDQVLFLLGCMCCERKVLLVSDDVSIVSMCVLALVALLEPLQWAGPVITVLPPRLDELLEAPVPLIAGRVSINSSFIRSFTSLAKPMRGVIEMNMDQNNLCMHEDDLSNYHELKLPGSEDITHELRDLSSKLYEKRQCSDFPTAAQKEACDSICDRLRRHMETICSLASGECTPSEFTDATCAFDSAHRRCSEIVVEFVERFRATQMFSTFMTRREDEASELRDEEVDDNEDEDNERTRIAEDSRTTSLCDSELTVAGVEDAMCYQASVS